MKRSFACIKEAAETQFILNELKKFSNKPITDMQTENFKDFAILGTLRKAPKHVA